ncbi:uncharacterized protein LOC124378540 [Silurus meridionalis]|uniref:uncharacterized protein LOC124378540 n=1 Tax=Silurus meridionalis TaxID=175797 RepID=UPI001EE9DCF1|nr:uncharacterized protein LOC124378540 [Silurus meridionalis]
MKKLLIFLLLFSGVLSFGTLCRALNDLTQPECTATNDSTSDFLMCVGFSSDPVAEEQQIHNLKGLIDALLDVFVLMNSGLGGVPLLNVSAGWSFNATALLQDNDIITAWLQIRMTPLLSSISQNFLTCLGYNNFSCQTYQTVVQELSQQFSSLDAQRQQWIYSYFMQPFLSKNTPTGCVIPGDTTQDWVTKNFGSFSVLAQIRDFSSINGFFNGLDVLHLLTPEQKAELMLYPETASLNQESLSVVLGSLLSSVTPSGGAVNSLNGTMQGTGLSVYSPSPQDPLRQTVNDIMTAFRPVGSFVREFVFLTHQQDLSSMRSATLIQAMLGWTLAELAAPYKNTSSNQQLEQTMFNASDVNSWFTHVVVPVLNRYLTSDIPDDLAAVFHNVFYMQNPVYETQDTCSVSLDGACAVANVMEHVAKVLQCAGSTNLTLTQETVTSLTLHLSSSLNRLLNQIANTNFSAEDSPFRDVLDRIHNPTHTDLRDKSFITMWFHIKLKPLLPSVTPDYLLCLSAKPFSCQTFQTLVWEMSNNMFLMPVNGTQVVYENFIIPFLLHQNSTGGCMSNSSLEWIQMNLGGFSQFATVQEMYLLNPEFDALEAFSTLTLKQVSEIIVEDLPQLPAKKQLIDITFSNMLTSLTMRQNLPQLIFLISEMDTINNCLIYQEMFSWLHFASLFANKEEEAVILISIDNLMKTTPSDCRSYSGTCNTTAINGSAVCDGVNSDALLDYLKTPHNGSQLCSFNITQYACAQVTDISAEDLVTLLSCYLYGNEVVSKETWKIFLMEVSPTLGPALDLFTNKTVPFSPPLVVDLLDVIADVILNTFSPNSFTNDSLIQLWFGNRLRPFLPYTSSNFLTCISKFNFSCETYQSIVQILSQQFNAMSNETQMSVYVYFIHTFLSNNNTAGCNTGGQSSDWLKLNVGPFAEFATITELQNLNPAFSVMDVLDSLTVTQLVEVCTSPGLITSAAQVVQVLDNVPDPELIMFFSKLSSTVTVGAMPLPTVVSKALLEQVFERVNLGDPNVPDPAVEQWINVGIKPFISNIQISQIPLYFNILTNHSCIISHQGVMVLNSAHSSFNSDTLQAIYNQLIIFLSGPELMKCYTYQSFYAFLKSYFIGFQFPSLSTFLSLIPPGRMAELLNSMSPAELSELLHNIGTVEDQNKLCELFNIYNQTENYLQSVTDLSAETLATVLSCYLYGNDTISNKTWKIFLTGVSLVLGPALDLFPNKTTPLSLPLVVDMLDVIGDVTFSSFSSSSFTNHSLIQLWFGNRLRPFLPYTSSNFLSGISKYSFSCETYQSIVQILGQQINAMSNETQMSVYVYFIHTFLSNNNTAGCNTGGQSSDWLKLNVGPFAEFATITELQNLNPAFSVMDVLDSLTVTQLVEVCTSPGLITSAAQVVQVLDNVPDPELIMFFSKLSSTVTVSVTYTLIINT